MCRQHGEQRDPQHAEHDEYQDIKGISTLGAQGLGNGNNGEKRVAGFCHAAAQHCHAQHGKIAAQQELSHPYRHNAAVGFLLGKVQQQKQQRQFVCGGHAAEKAFPNGIVGGECQILRFCLRNGTNTHDRQRNQQDSQNHGAAAGNGLDPQRYGVQTYQCNQCRRQKLFRKGQGNFL